MPDTPRLPRTASETLNAVVANALQSAGVMAGRLVLGLSGGLDSMVLLDVLAALRDSHRVDLSALHVNHQLSPHAQRWARLCAECCESYQVPLRVVRVEVPRASTAGLEAAARSARYAVFREQQADAIVLAHHLDDQAETLLLQLLRGAGPRGLAAMPLARPIGDGNSLQVVRPLLEASRAQLAAHARQRGLRWVDDESNFDTERDRNYLRHEVLPRIDTRFPGYRQAWMRASRNFADLIEIADAQADADARGALVAGGLQIARLEVLSSGRARNLLRWYLARAGLPFPQREQLQELLRQLRHARADAQPSMTFCGVRLYRERGLLKLAAAPDALPVGWEVVWRGESGLALPGALGTLLMAPVVGAGLSAHRLAGRRISVRARAGGERFKLAANRPTRTLKNLLQEAEIPSWQRDRLPLLFCDDTLIWVAQIGADCRFAAGADEAGILPTWQPAPGSV